MLQEGMIEEDQVSKSTVIFDGHPLRLMVIGFVTALTIPYILSKLSELFQFYIILIGDGLILLAVSKIAIIRKDFHVLFCKKPTSIFYRVIAFVGYFLIVLGGFGLILLLFYNR